MGAGDPELLDLKIEAIEEQISLQEEKPVRHLTKGEFERDLRIS